MIRLTITAGTGEDRNGNAIPGDKLAQAMAEIRGRLAATFGGFSEFTGQGGWINGDGRLVMEPCARFVVLTDDGHGTDAAARMVQRALNQASVLVEVETIAAEFVNAEPEKIAA